MQVHTPRILWFVAVLLCAAPVAAAAQESARLDMASVARIGAMMAVLGAESRRDAARIEAAYGRVVTRAGLRDRDALTASLRHGYISALPSDAARFNLRPRLGGEHPIGEKDLAHQHLYVAARPGTLGLLFHLAARVSAPLDVTSLVRHQAYQRALQRTNPNARTRVPTHALGLAFDISVLYATPDDAIEIRDVLRRMRADGALFFVAEQRQLVFHVVPHPDRLDFYAALFDGLAGVPGPPREDRPAAGLIAVTAPPAPDMAWMDRTEDAGEPPVAFAYAVLFGSIAASGVGASLRRRAARPTSFLRG